jgi:cytochrome c-type biogenesis protein CcmH/NrfG
MTTRRQQLEALLAADPTDPFVLYGLAMEDEADGDTAGAVDRLQRLIDDFPEYVPAFLQVGQMLIKQERLREAKDYLKMGMDVAMKVANHHAYGEMEGILQSIS